MRPFLLLDDAAPGGTARLLSDPVESVALTHADDIAVLWDWLRAARRRAAAEGGAVGGWLGYEAGLALEPRLRSLLPGDVPLGWFARFAGDTRLDADALAAFLGDPEGAWLSPPVPTIGAADHRAALDRIIGWIEAGDIYQANLTFMAEARAFGDPRALFAALRARAAAPYGALLFDGACWLLSLSPEHFFSAKGGTLSARPMKGTARRLDDPAADAAAAAALAADAKQRAENLMIVDLIRNDLSRVAAPGSVAVPALFRVETYPTIHQMTSTVTARLAGGRDSVDALAALFPCGSITGAPKLRAMEVIAATEQGPRGAYCGSIGVIDGNGDASFNVAIRTLSLPAVSAPASMRPARLGLGSGIVADSRHADEWAECLAKGGFASMGPPRFDLIETMRFEPDHGIARLDRHLDRMKASAAALGFAFDRHEARNLLHAASFHRDGPARVRLVAAPSGALAVALGPLPPAPAEPWRVALAPIRVRAEDLRRHHKTSSRRFYDEPRLALGTDEILFVDEDGMLAEGSFTSLFVERDGVLLTPPASRALPGVLRAELMDTARAREAELTPADVRDGFLLGNSLRGLVRARLAEVSDT